jgi:hypothetical protein
MLGYIEQTTLIQAVHRLSPCNHADKRVAPEGSFGYIVQSKACCGPLDWYYIIIFSIAVEPLSQGNRRNLFFQWPPFCIDGHSVFVADLSYALT